MFIKAIDKATEFTRPIHSIMRGYGSSLVTPGAATLFFVNKDGWALTCKHVVNQLAAADTISAQYKTFRIARGTLGQGTKRKHQLRDLEKQYGYTHTTTVELLNAFANCIEGTLDLECRAHSSVDVALLHFRNYTRQLCTIFPMFAADGAQLKPGKSLCRLGFPFPEFTNFEYNVAVDEIRWTTAGRTNTPQFPIDGMVTRHVADAAGSTIGFEMSTPGLRGQSGGPAFDINGVIWGMQAATSHLDLDFDVDTEVLRGGQKKRVRDNAFLHVGHCVHVDVLKQFMRDNGVAFQEA